MSALLSLLTTDARTSYPWPLCWGNALWGFVAFKLYRRDLKSADRPGMLFSCLITYACWTMPANIFTNLLILSRAPSALTNKVIFPIHVTACVLVEYFPGLFTLLSSAVGLAFIDSLAVLDNMTTALNFMEESYALYGSPVQAIAAAMCVNLAGGIARHFLAYGYTAGAAKFDVAFRVNFAYSLITNSLYYFYAVVPCGALTLAPKEKVSLAAKQSDCLNATQLYELLALVGVVKNLLLPLVLASLSATPKQKVN